jgi:hypothetical protein
MRLRARIVQARVESTIISSAKKFDKIGDIEPGVSFSFDIDRLLDSPMKQLNKTGIYNVDGKTSFLKIAIG